MTEGSRKLSSAYLCDSCADTGSVRVFGAEDYGCSFESENCESCRLGAAMTALDQATYDRAPDEIIDRCVEEVAAAQAEVDAHA